MLRLKTCAAVALALVLVWVFCSRLAEWLMTGQLWVTSRYQPGHYVTFWQDPVLLLLGFALSVFMVGAGLMMVVAAIIED